MTGSRAEGPAAPAALAARYADREWVAVSAYPPDSVTYRLRPRSGADHYLKLARPGHHPSLAAEAERTRWGGAHLPVPNVLEVGSGEDVSWLLTEGLRGHDATDARWSTDVPRLVRALARGLRAIHETPVRDCPFDFRLHAALELVRRRVRAGLADPERDFHQEHAHLSVEDAWRRLEETRPLEDTLVVCHGDYCAPNILLEAWEPVGYVDLGELGVADRWWDLAVATWSVGWNFGPRLEGTFLEEYGVEEEPERMAYYRLLYDLVS